MRSGQIESVVDRLAAAGPSKVRAPHCWFCGKNEPWFTCDCREAKDAQQGKRAKPRFDAKLGAMILDEEIIQRNLAWGFARRYVPTKAKPAKQPRVTPPPVIALPGPAYEAVSTPESSVSTGPANKSANTPSEAGPVSTDAANERAEARKVYQRELMRRRRAADAAAKDQGDKS